MSNTVVTMSFDEFFPNWIEGGESCDDTRAGGEMAMDGSNRSGRDSDDSLSRGRGRTSGPTVETPGQRLQAIMRRYVDGEGESDEDYDLWLRLH